MVNHSKVESNEVKKKKRLPKHKRRKVKKQKDQSTKKDEDISKETIKARDFSNDLNNYLVLWYSLKYNT